MMLRLLAVWLCVRSCLACPSIEDGSLHLLGGDGSLVLKNLAVDFSVTVSTNQTQGFSVSVNGDAIGNELSVSGNSISGLLKFKDARRRSPESDAPGRSSECSPRFPCYGRATVVLSDDSGVCADATFDFTPSVQLANAPLVPLLISAVLGPITRDPIITLVFAGWIARCMLEGDAWIAALRYLDTDLLETLMGGSFASLFLFTIMIAGITGAAMKSGGVKAVGEKISEYVKNSFLGQLAVYAAGFVFFIDDYSNTVIVGSTLRCITDTMRLSREKLAFLVDCTASPIASVMPLSTWIGYEVALINEEIARIGYNKEGGYTLFIMSISHRFYSWFMLIFVATLILSGRDFGPMYWAEKRARETGVLSVGQADTTTLVPPDLEPHANAPKRAFNAALPFALFILLFFPLLYYSGAKQVSWGGVGWNVGSRTIVGNADSWQTLYWVCGLIMLTQITMYAAQRSPRWGGSLLTPSQTVAAWISGTHVMYGGLVALLVAFAFASNLKQLLIADYLVDVLGDSLSEATLPATMFCLCAVYAFATGTSWGTMAVFFQPCFALAVYLYRDNGAFPDKSLDTVQFTDFLVKCIAAILGGATWGDHCSFVSDTTILSATSSACPLWSHYLTQAPYAALCGVAAILFGFLPNGAGAPAGLCIALAFVVQPGIIYGLSSIPAIGGVVPNYDPSVGLTDGGFLANLASVVSTFKVDASGTGKTLLEEKKAAPIKDELEVA